MSLSCVEDFKNVTAYPSGRDVATGKETKPKYNKTEKMMCAGIVAVPVLIGGLVIGMAAHAQKIENEVRNYPEEKKQEMTSAYDASLLSTIDSLYETGIPMEKAVEKGVQLHTYRVKNTTFDADGIIQTAHARQRLAQSREIDHINTRKEASMEYSVLYKRMTLEEKTVYDTVYTYKPEFRNQLAEELRDYQKSVQQPPTAKTAIPTAAMMARKDNSR